MRKLISLGVAMLIACPCAVSAARASDLGLITGVEKGTYYQFGLDLKKLVRRAGINLTVYPSKGAVENIYAVYQRPGVHLGIVQSDVLAFVAAGQSDPALLQIAQKIRLVFPLYTEEVHVLARRGIGEFDDLAGKRVAVGLEESGTFLTARLLFKLSEVTPGEMLAIDTGEAVAKLKAGRIDAFLYVAGAPVKLLNSDVSEADGLALIPISNKSTIEIYPRAEIPANVYKWQTMPVSTVGVKALLVSFDFRGPGCDQVGRFARQVATGLDWLTRNGHPKWKAVDLDAPLKAWTQSDCVRKYLARPSRAASAAPGVTVP